MVWPENAWPIRQKIGQNDCKPKQSLKKGILATPAMALGQTSLKDPQKKQATDDPGSVSALLSRKIACEKPTVFLGHFSMNGGVLKPL